MVHAQDGTGDGIERGGALERARRMMRISFCAVSVVLMVIVTGRSRYMMYGMRSVCISPVRRCVLRLVRASRGYAAAGVDVCADAAALACARTSVVLGR